MRLAGAILCGVCVSVACAEAGEHRQPFDVDGRGRTFEIAPVGPRLRVASPAVAVDSLRVRVSPLQEASRGTDGVQVRFRVLRGGARMLGETAATDSLGYASVAYAPAGEPDSTIVRVDVVEDPAAATDLVVLARPELALGGELGDVLAVPGAGGGVLLRIASDQTYDLVPYVTSSDRARREYVFRQGRAVRAAAAWPAATARALHRADPALRPTLRHPGPRPAGVPAPSASPARLPPVLDVYNCLLHERGPAPLTHVGARIALYVGGLVPADSAPLSEIARRFDEEVFPRTARLFGSALDRDRNGRILAVLTPRMRGGAYCDSVHRFGGEVVYAGWDRPHGVDTHLSMLAHELQHVIHASHRWRADPEAAPAGAAWLNEGLSHVADWKAGFPAGNLGRTFAFLGTLNRSLPLLGSEPGPPFFAGWFLFALYLGDRFGEGVYLDLEEEGLAGREAVERITGIPFRDLLRDWFVTLALSDLPAVQPAWSYRSIRLADESERAAACDCLPADRLPGVAFERIPAGRDLALLRTLAPRDADFFRFAAGAVAGALYFDAGGDPDVELFAVRRR